MCHVFEASKKRVHLSGCNEADATRGPLGLSSCLFENFWQKENWTSKIDSMTHIAYITPLIINAASKAKKREKKKKTIQKDLIWALWPIEVH